MHRSTSHWMAPSLSAPPNIARRARRLAAKCSRCRSFCCSGRATAASDWKKLSIDSMIDCANARRACCWAAVTFSSLFAVPMRSISSSKRRLAANIGNCASSNMDAANCRCPSSSPAESSISSRSLLANTGLRAGPPPNQNCAAAC